MKLPVKKGNDELFFEVVDADGVVLLIAQTQAIQEMIIEFLNSVRKT